MQRSNQKTDKPKGLTLPEHERRIAEKIVELMEREGINWIKPWSTAGFSFFNATSGHRYSGGNIFTLMIESWLRGIDDPRFLTFKQARNVGGSVKKGSKGIPIVYYSTAQRENENGEQSHYRFAKLSYVFPVDCVEGLEEGAILPLPEAVDQNPDETIGAAEIFFARCKSDLRHGGDSAYYSPKQDYIQMPNFQHFLSAETYYSTLAHEHIHWTGAASRLDRGLFADGFDYAFEELVAEIGSAFLCDNLGIAPEPREENAAYIKAWMKRIKDTPHAFWKAASLATRAADFLKDAQPQIDRDAA